MDPSNIPDESTMADDRVVIDQKAVGDRSAKIAQKPKNINEVSSFVNHFGNDMVITVEEEPKQDGIREEIERMVNQCKGMVLETFEELEALQNNNLKIMLKKIDDVEDEIKVSAERGDVRVAIEQILNLHGKENSHQKHLTQAAEENKKLAENILKILEDELEDTLEKNEKCDEILADIREKRKSVKKPIEAPTPDAPATKEEIPVVKKDITERIHRPDAKERIQLEAAEKILRPPKLSLQDRVEFRHPQNVTIVQEVPAKKPRMESPPYYQPTLASQVTIPSHSSLHPNSGLDKKLKSTVSIVQPVVRQKGSDTRKEEKQQDAEAKEAKKVAEVAEPKPSPSPTLPSTQAPFPSLLAKPTAVVLPVRRIEPIPYIQEVVNKEDQEVWDMAVETREGEVEEEEMDKMEEGEESKDSEDSKTSTDEVFSDDDD